MLFVLVAEVPDAAEAVWAGDAVGAFFEAVIVIGTSAFGRKYGCPLKGPFDGANFVVRNVSVVHPAPVTLAKRRAASAVNRTYSFRTTISSRCPPVITAAEATAVKQFTATWLTL
jgi:hypothetical protein